MQNCSLGCSETGCSRTDIAQNEIIILQFSQAIDPASVNASTIRLRTASGDQPVGEFFVNGNQVEFVPTIAVFGGQTFYGFAPGATYTMTIPGGKSQTQTVRSTSGKPFAKTLSCNLRSSLGIVDHNGVPPRATLLTPTPAQITNAPRDTDIVLEFNEFIDATPFLGGGSAVEFKVRRTRETLDPNDGDARECDPLSTLMPLAGSASVSYDAPRAVSSVTFRPSQDLPANVCVDVTVTSAVTDLSGQPAQPQQFSFMTEQVPLTEHLDVEEFVTAQHFDEEASAATWGGGQAVFARIGGDARHGTFSVALGTYVGLVSGKDTYRFDTNNTVIPGSNTITGAPLLVTDGKYYFDKMVVPSNVRLRFVGTLPPVFTVAGRLDLQGEIDVSGTSITTFPGTLDALGQNGADGGVFGAKGGKGGDKNPGTGVQPLLPYQGSDGLSARVLAGHAYATSATLTGGKGSTIWPASGHNNDLLFATGGTNMYTPSATAGGGGGGLFAAGLNGRVITNSVPSGGFVLPITTSPPLVAAMGPDAPGGAAMVFQPFPPIQPAPPTPPFSTKSSVHFLVGGSGGGGAGSLAALCRHTLRSWVAGGGGAGGGGAIALRAGDSLRLGPLAKVIAVGGNTPASNGPTVTPQPAPGGGGSGGSIVLQSGRLAELQGTIDVRGGTGGLWNRSATGVPATPSYYGCSVQLTGGNGSAGYVRFETPSGPSPGDLVAMQPPASAANVGVLEEHDDFVSLRSDFYSTGLVFGPEYTRYEIHALVDGVPVVFSDDPAHSTIPAGPGAPIRALFQCANLDLATNQVLETRPWRTQVRSADGNIGIQSDGLNGYRFLLIMDSALAQSVTVDKVVIAYEN